MPLSHSNAGTNTSSNPLSCVLVVVASVISLDCGRSFEQPSKKQAKNSKAEWKLHGISVHHFPLNEIRRPLIGRAVEECFFIGDLDQPTTQE